MEELELAKQACTFMTAGPTPFHNCVKMIEQLGEGFEMLDEMEPFEGKIKVSEGSEGRTVRLSRQTLIPSHP